MCGSGGYSTVVVSSTLNSGGGIYSSTLSQVLHFINTSNKIKNFFFSLFMVNDLLNEI